MLVQILCTLGPNGICTARRRNCRPASDIGVSERPDSDPFAEKPALRVERGGLARLDLLSTPELHCDVAACQVGQRARPPNHLVHTDDGRLAAWGNVRHGGAL